MCYGLGLRAFGGGGGNFRPPIPAFSNVWNRSFSFCPRRFRGGKDFLYGLLKQAFKSFSAGLLYLHWQKPAPRQSPRTQAHKELEDIFCAQVPNNRPTHPQHKPVSLQSQTKFLSISGLRLASLSAIFKALKPQSPLIPTSFKLRKREFSLSHLLLPRQIREQQC